MNTRRIKRLAAFAVAATIATGAALSTAAPAAAAPAQSPSTVWYNNGGWKPLDATSAARTAFLDAKKKPSRAVCTKLESTGRAAKKYKPIPDAQANGFYRNMISRQRAGAAYCLNGSQRNATAAVKAANAWYQKLNDRFNKIGVWGVG